MGCALLGLGLLGITDVPGPRPDEKAHFPGLTSYCPRRYLRWRLLRHCGGAARIEEAGASEGTVRPGPSGRVPFWCAPNLASRDPRNASRSHYPRAPGAIQHCHQATLPGLDRPSWGTRDPAEPRERAGVQVPVQASALLHTRMDNRPAAFSLQMVRFRTRAPGSFLRGALSPPGAR